MNYIKRQLDRGLRFAHYTPGEAMFVGVVLGFQVGVLITVAIIVTLLALAAIPTGDI